METDLRLEKLALGVMCVGTPQGPVKESAMALLRDYDWQAPLHQAVFRALAAIPTADPAVLRQLLPAKLTRMGFPEVEWEEFFAPHSLSSEESIALIGRLAVGA